MGLFQSLNRTLEEEGIIGVLRVRGVCHLLLHVDKVAKRHVLGLHLHPGFS